MKEFIEPALNNTTAELNAQMNGNLKANLFTVAKKNVHSVSVELEANKEYQFRYLANGQVWLNESESDKHVLTHFGDSENSVIIV
ncbi:MAG: early set domain-containing protein [Ignavibacteriaceae bacterium]